jgi:hypothetical protein
LNDDELFLYFLQRHTVAHRHTNHKTMTGTTFVQISVDLHGVVYINNVNREACGNSGHWQTNERNTNANLPLQ